MSAALLESRAALLDERSRDFVHTVLAETDRATAFTAWTNPFKRMNWWGEAFGGVVLEAVEPVWLVLTCRSAVIGGETIEEQASVTFVQLGERTHIALHATVAHGQPNRYAPNEAAWRRRLQELCLELSGSVNTSSNS